MSVRDRILFPAEDHSVVDVNNVSGVRRRLQERNVGAGDLLVVTNTYRSANYVDHEGKPRDVYDFDRKGSTPRVRGKRFLTRLETCKVPENHSLSLWGE